MKETAWSLFRHYCRMDQDGGLNFKWTLWPLLFSEEKIERIHNNDALAGEFLTSWEEKEAIQIMKEAREILNKKKQWKID